MISQVKEERPTVLRSSIVEKYVHSVLSKKQNAYNYDKKFEIVKLMHRLKLDNRVLNNMRQKMNESIVDERGLMSKQDF